MIGLTVKLVVEYSVNILNEDIKKMKSSKDTLGVTYTEAAIKLARRRVINGNEIATFIKEEVIH